MTQVWAVETPLPQRATGRSAVQIHPAILARDGTAGYPLVSLEESGRTMDFTVEIERETDGRWIAEVPELPGVLAYGDTQAESIAKVQALALRVIADRLEHGEAQATLSIRFKAA